jgi:hypothetical protein
MNLVTLGILPLAAVVFLVWMAVRNLQNNLSAASRWSLVAVAGLGLVLMPLGAIWRIGNDPLGSTCRYIHAGHEVWRSVVDR